MKQALIRFLLRLLGAPVPRLPDLPIFAIVLAGERVADVTTNRNRAIACAREASARGEAVTLWRYEAATRERFELP